jgi:K+-transporting ATPase ATPase A chain
VIGGLAYTFGQLVGDRRQGWALIAAMAILLIAGVAVIYWAETRATRLTALGVDASPATWRARKSASARR